MNYEQIEAKIMELHRAGNWREAWKLLNAVQWPKNEQERYMRLLARVHPSARP